MNPRDSKRFVIDENIYNAEIHELRNPIGLLNNIPWTALLPDHQILLEKGYVLMRLQNLTPKNGDMNGTGYVVKFMTDKIQFLPITTGNNDVK